MSRLSRGKGEEKASLSELLEAAAKRRFGSSILILKHPWATEDVDNLRFDIEIINQDPKPVETKRTIVDINMKEYTNPCEKEVDQTLVRVKKTSSKTTGSRYSFSTTKGVTWGVGGKIGAQVMGAAMGAVNLGVDANYSRSKSTTEEKEETESHFNEFSYEQEENIKVPPKRQVKAKITTYSMKYERGYTLKLSLPSTRWVKVVYKTTCQRMCCGFNTRFITPAQLCSTLPDFKEEDGKVSFVQPGTLAWVGEGSVIEKEVLPLDGGGITL